MDHGRQGRAARGVCAAAVVLAVAACAAPAPAPSTASGAASARATSSAPAGVVETIATGLDAPWSIAFHGDVPLVSERDTARILALDDDGGTRHIGTVAGVVPEVEGGLLGIAVHDSHLYACSTGVEGNRIERYSLEGEGRALVLGPAETVLDGIPSAQHHNGGRIAFGPDGMLYATTGDAGEASAAQDRGSLAGKILRMRPDGGEPGDNPFPGSLVYSWGHRNAQGLAWDDDGALYASEFGQNTWDELNVVEPGANYGWPDVEGAAGREEFVDPVQQWRPAEASPSGIAIAGGQIYIANLRGERLRVVPLGDPAAADEQLVGEFGRLRDAVLGPDGALWVLTNNTDGRGDPDAEDDRVLRIDLGAD
ncbi:glucose dehydrogenase [Kocuria polaris]|nr:glucose dehydrogenase [Kocuria polaris]